MMSESDEKYRTVNRAIPAGPTHHNTKEKVDVRCQQGHSQPLGGRDLE